MAPLAKLVVISEMEGEVSLVKNRLVFLHLDILVEKQPCFVSTSSNQLSVKSFLFLKCMRLILLVYKTVAQPDSGLLGPVPYHQFFRPHHYQLGNSITNQTRKEMHHSSCSASTVVCMQQIANLLINTLQIISGHESLQNLLECNSSRDAH